MKPIGLNILAQTVGDRAALVAYIKRSVPALTVVMDAPELAQQIRAASPKTLVVHRTYHQADSRWHEVSTPKEFLDAHKPTAANGVVVQCFNEPSGAGLFAASTWIEQLIQQCQPDMTLALPNMSKGNPSEVEILAGKYDRILRAICGTRHYLALHEYFENDPLAETPYYCGRFTFWQRRARQLGLPAPKIIITEHGRDLGGGAKDGWRDTGWSEDQYFARMVQARELYKPHGIPVAVYCYGAGFSQRWQSFNVEGATTLLDKMASYQEADMPDYPAGSNPAQKLINHTAGLKLRAEPNLKGAIVGVMPYKTQVTVYGDPILGADGYFWQRVDWGTNKGWAANSVNGVASFVDPVAHKFTLIRPIGCDTIVTSNFGVPRDYDGDGTFDDKHEGTDYAPAHKNCHPPILAGADGVVIKVSNVGAYGNHVVLEHDVGGDVYRTWYCHLDKAFVTVGQTVKQGDYLGIMGTTGNSTGVHLHFSLQWIGHGLSGFVLPDVVDPTPYFEQALSLAA